MGLGNADHSSPALGDYYELLDFYTFLGTSAVFILSRTPLHVSFGYIQGYWVVIGTPLDCRLFAQLIL